MDSSTEEFILHICNGVAATMLIILLNYII